MSSVFDNTNICDKFFSLIRNVKSRIKMCHTDKQLEETVTTECIHDIDIFLNQKQIKASLVVDFVKDNY
jgi:hypothetical protein